MFDVDAGETAHLSKFETEMLVERDVGRIVGLQIG